MTEVEEDHSQEYETYTAESAARRADKLKEVEELSNTRSPARHPLALLARSVAWVQLLQADTVFELFTSKPVRNTKRAAASRR